MQTQWQGLELNVIDRIAMEKKYRMLLGLDKSLPMRSPQLGGNTDSFTSVRVFNQP